MTTCVCKARVVFQVFAIVAVGMLAVQDSFAICTTGPTTTY